MLGSLRRWRNDRWRRKRGFDDSSGTWVAVGVAAILLAGCGGGGQSHPQASPAPAPSHSRSWNGWAGVSPTTVPPTTIPAPKPHQQAPRASRSAPAPQGGDFWRRLANCESSDGRSGYYTGYFQFSPTNAAHYGINGTSSYEQQKAAAQDLAAHSNPRQQWPVCWARAGG